MPYYTHFEHVVAFMRCTSFEFHNVTSKVNYICLVLPLPIWHVSASRSFFRILDLRPANERLRYFVTTYLIGWAQT